MYLAKMYSFIFCRLTLQFRSCRISHKKKHVTNQRMIHGANKKEFLNQSSYFRKETSRIVSVDPLSKDV